MLLAHLVPFPDFDFDGAITVADLAPMLGAMSSPQTYLSQHNLSSDDFVSMGDLNGDGKVTNADVQSLVNMLAGGGSASLAAVPEPSTMCLLAVGGMLIFGVCRRA